MPIIVMKFGGTSVAGLERIQKVADIIKKETKNYKIVVVLSAMAGVRLFEQLPPAQIRVKLNNVFHTEYYDHTSFYRLIDVPEAGRNLSVSLTIPF